MQKTDWENIHFYFEEIPKAFLWFEKFPIWQWQENISAFLDYFFGKINSHSVTAEIKKFYKKEELYFSETILLEKEASIPDLKIYLAKGVRIEAGASIQKNCIALEKSEIRQSAYIRKNAIIGEHCTVGHATEIKNSILFSHSEVGHFNYLGDSVVGSYCNLGAGSILCNLPFRTLSQKKKQEFPKFSFNTPQKKELSCKKRGVVLGDGCETGCNSVLGPMSFLGKSCVVYPNVYVAKGVFPEGSVFKTAADYQKFNLLYK